MRTAFANPPAPLQDPRSATAPSEDDAGLAARAAAGDTAAFEKLMRRYNRRLFRVARSILRDDDAAEDALQEAYLHAWASLPSFRGDAGLATWLTRIAANEALARRRAAQRVDRRRVWSDAGATEDDVLDAAGDDPNPTEALAMRTELRALLERHIDRLSDGHRAVFVLRAVEELSVEETAACLGLSDAAVKTRFLRARRTLRDALSREVRSGLHEAFGFAGARCDRVVARVLTALVPRAKAAPSDSG